MLVSERINGHETVRALTRVAYRYSHRHYARTAAWSFHSATKSSNRRIHPRSHPRRDPRPRSLAGEPGRRTWPANLAGDR